MVPCERTSDESYGLYSNADVWGLKDHAIKLLDTCADQIDAQILRRNSE